MATDDILALAFIVILVVLLGATLVLARGGRTRRRNRRFRRDETGEVVALGSTRVGDPTPIEGKGSFTGSPSQLRAGHYVLSYEFHTPTRVALVAQIDGDEETVLMGSGAGLKEIEVAVGGTYLWRVEPNIADSEWRITYRPVVRRGR